MVDRLERAQARRWILGGLVCLLMVLGGCGVAVRQYVYPPTHGVNESLLGPLFTTLKAEGIAPERTEDSVDFQFDAITRVRYLLKPSFCVAVITDRRKFDSKEALDAHFQVTRARAEEILGKARTLQAKSQKPPESP